MMSRKRSRACASSRAWPRSVSMKPETAASGVRNSWLALATKSARICSARLIAVRSCSSSDRQRRLAPRARDIGLVVALHRHRQRELDRRRSRRSPWCCAIGLEHRGRAQQRGDVLALRRRCRSRRASRGWRTARGRSRRAASADRAVRSSTSRASGGRRGSHRCASRLARCSAVAARRARADAGDAARRPRPARRRPPRDREPASVGTAAAPTSRSADQQPAGAETTRRCAIGRQNATSMRVPTNSDRIIRLCD